MDEKIKEAFRMAVEKLLDIEIDGSPHILRFPRVLFASAVHALKKGENLYEEERKELLEQFLEILKERKIRIKNKAFLRCFRMEERRKRKNHGKPNWVSPQMMREAAGRELYHSKRSQG